jgi:hypothetical protein
MFYKISRMKKTQLLFIFCVFITQLQAQNGFYKHLKGTIGNYPITMDLTKTEKSVANGILVLGTYSYDNSEGLLLIEGKMKSDSLVFTENDNIKKTGRFALKQLNDYDFEGTWTNLTTHKTLKVSLNETYTEGAIKFNYIGMSDSIDIFKEATKKWGKPSMKIENDKKIISSYKMYFERLYLEPQSDKKELNSLILKSIHACYPEESYKLNFPIKDNFLFQKENAKNYWISILQAQCGDLWKKDTVWSLSDYFFDNKIDNRTYFILCNDGHILTIAYFYPLRGYGNFRRTRVISIDRATQKQIHLNSFLNAEINDVIKKDVLKYFNISKPPENQEELSMMKYFPYIQYTTPSEDGDFGITSKGLFLAGFKKYNGDLPWVLNWSKIKSKVKPTFYEALKIK